MMVTRRQIVRHAAVCAGGFALGGSVVSAAASSTPVASPDAVTSSLLIDARYAVGADADEQFMAIMDEKTFNRSHVLGAILIPWSDLALVDTSEDAVASWTDQMRELVAVKGVWTDQPVVIYDEGTLFAARGWWQLAYLGYPLQKVLDGGLPAWISAGGKTEKEQPALNSAEVPLIEAEVRRDFLATKAEVLGLLGAPDVLIVDARSPDEYKKGHIPGAVNVQYTTNAVAEKVNTYLSPETLRGRYEALGMTDAKRAITYCSTGVRGSVASFAMRLAGFQQVALYVGSWDEWSTDPNDPVEKGT